MATKMGFKKNPYDQHGMKKVSDAQRARTEDWQEKFRLYKSMQTRMTGTCYCEAGIKGPWLGKKCLGLLEPDHVIPRGRCPKDVDSIKNMQALCHGHHWLKTYTPGEGDHDFRSAETKAELEKIDAEQGDEK